ncbi:MAG: type I phosphomannose isomerase catalytic subunit [Malacoplasma sp.]
MKEKILFLEPYFEDKIWGNDFFLKNNFNVKSSTIGEAFIVSALKNKSSHIINKDISLYDFFNDPKNSYFFNGYNKPYPLLVKIISASDDLSVQVHPDNKYALDKHKMLGKNECWYILDSTPNNSIIYGHKALSKEEIKKFIEQNNWDFLKSLPISKNDFIYVPAGKIHAIKKGTLIFELQQSSDITYRLYDYNRLENNKKRDLHIEDSLNVITVPDDEIDLIKEGKENSYLINNDFFSLLKVKIFISKTLFIPLALWLQITVIKGFGKVNGSTIKKYDSFIVAHGTKLNFVGFIEILVSYIK